MASISTCSLAALLSGSCSTDDAHGPPPQLDRFAVKLDATANAGLRSFRLLSYNVDNAMREEGVEATKWAKRKYYVRDLIAKSAADVVCLQELRNLPGHETVEEFVASVAAALGGYHFDIAYRNPSPLSFAHAILWCSSKFTAVRKETRWLSRTPHILSDSLTQPLDAKSPAYIMQGVLLALVQGDKMAVDQGGDAHPFWVFNTHLGMDESLKTQSCKSLLSLLGGGGGGRHAYLLCGDFNFFPDQDADKQRAILTDAGLIDMGTTMVTSQTHTAIAGTFIGYEHDNFKPDDATKPTGRLDNVFASDARIRQEGPMVAWTETMHMRTDGQPEDDPPAPVYACEPVELSDRNELPSDHLPISVDVSIVAF